MKTLKLILKELKEIKKALQTIASSLECVNTPDSNHDVAINSELRLTEIIASLLRKQDHQ